MVSSLLEFILSYDKHLVNISFFLFSGYLISSIVILFNYFGDGGGEIYIVTLFHHMNYASDIVLVLVVEDPFLEITFDLMLSYISFNCSLHTMLKKPLTSENKRKVENLS